MVDRKNKEELERFYKKRDKWWDKVQRDTVKDDQKIQTPEDMVY